MKKAIIAGNWKMQGTLQDIQAWCNTLASQPMPEGVDILFFPPAVFIDLTQHLLATTKIQWGAQTMSEHKDGAFTGEISASMIETLGCSFVLIGHSERRQHFGEHKPVVAAKIAAALESRLNPILCIGETQQEQASGQTQAVLSQQLDAIKACSPEQLKRCTIAYEPVWAIGTGLAATPQQAQSIHKMIRDQFANIAGKTLADRLNILYGGSANPNNAEALLSMPDIDGLLLGKASLTTEPFLKIIEIAGALSIQNAPSFSHNT